MTTIKCRKCGKVYPFDEKICPVCGYDIRKDENIISKRPGCTWIKKVILPSLMKQTKKIWNAGRTRQRKSV